MVGVSIVGRFNSKLVRLKVDMCECAERKIQGFNSKLVRLKGYTGFGNDNENYVSIPNWFD